MQPTAPASTDPQLTPHFRLSELTASQTATRRGLDNTPGPVALGHLRRLAEVLERVRAAVGHRPVVISSGYRSPLVNAAVRGSRHSAHMHGLAADFSVPGWTRLAVCRAILADASIQFDQLIYEGTWVHLGLAAPGVPPRRQVMTAEFLADGNVRYLAGLPAGSDHA